MCGTESKWPDQSVACEWELESIGMFGYPLPFMFYDFSLPAMIMADCLLLLSIACGVDGGCWSPKSKVHMFLTYKKKKLRTCTLNNHINPLTQFIFLACITSSIVVVVVSGSLTHYSYVGLLNIKLLYLKEYSSKILIKTKTVYTFTHKSCKP